MKLIGYQGEDRIDGATVLEVLLESGRRIDGSIDSADVRCESEGKPWCRYKEVEREGPCELAHQPHVPEVRHAEEENECRASDLENVKIAPVSSSDLLAPRGENLGDGESDDDCKRYEYELEYRHCSRCLTDRRSAVSDSADRTRPCHGSMPPDGNPGQSNRAVAGPLQRFVGRRRG